VKELYVGNLFYGATLDDVTALFTPYGDVQDARLVAERDAERPHAYAFVVMEERVANQAMAALDGEDFMGLTLLVEEATSDSAESARGVLRK
jgi:RNA recognition motif-containing protein